MNKKEFAVIFDMDGVIIDNSIYHEKAWKIFFERRGVVLTEKEFKETVLGRTGKDFLKLYFNNISDLEIKEYANEVNAIYRHEYAPYIKAAPGLVNFLEELKQNNIPAAVATSAPPVNVEYVIGTLKIGDYFSSIVDDTKVTKGKPDPEVYMLSANALNYAPSHCVVFEDSILGIQAARNAGMKVIGVATTHNISELENVELAINTFDEIDIDKISSLF